MCAESCATTSGELGSRWANPSFRERSSRGIAGEITELADITRFRAGCPSWCTAVPKAAAAVAPLLPPSCLVLLTLPLPEHHPAASPRHGRPPPPLLCVPTRVDPRHRVERRKLRLGVVPSAGRARLPLLPFDRHTPAIRTGRPHQKIAGLPRRSDRPKMRARWVVAATPHFDSKLPSRVWTTNHHQVRPAVVLAAPPSPLGMDGKGQSSQKKKGGKGHEWACTTADYCKPESCRSRRLTRLKKQQVGTVAQAAGCGRHLFFKAGIKHCRPDTYGHDQSPETRIRAPALLPSSSMSYGVASTQCLGSA
jgi:hypothetical protein